MNTKKTKTSNKPKDNKPKDNKQKDNKQKDNKQKEQKDDEQTDIMDIDALSMDDIGVNNEVQIDYAPNGKQIIPITKSGAFIKFSLIANKSYVKKIENHFTLRFMQVTGMWSQSKRCRVDYEKERIIVPRFGVYELFNNGFGLDDHTTNCQITEGQDCKFEWNAQLNNNQKIISKYMLENIYTNKRMTMGSAGCVLNLAAGQGKSYLASYLMSIFNKKTIIIVHSTSMIEQWSNVLRTCYPNIKIGYYYNKAKVMGDVMIMLINSAIKDKFTFKSKINKNAQTNEEDKGEQTYTAMEFYSMFGFIIYDECHLYANNNSGQVFKVAQSRYMLGLSATPDENARGFDRIHLWEIGPILNASLIKGYEKIASEFKATVHRVQYYGPEEYCQNIIEPSTGMVSVTKILCMLACDMKRASYIVDCICKCLELNLFTYVFADRREYLELLRRLLSSRIKVQTDIVVNDADFVRLVGGSKASDLETAEIKSKCIFTTFAYGATGRSIIKMNAIVLATPRKSGMKQTIGRILRLGSDVTIKRQIYDIVDMKLGLKSQWNHRKYYYEAMGFDIVEEKIKHEDIPDINLNLSVNYVENQVENKEENKSENKEESKSENKEEVKVEVKIEKKVEKKEDKPKKQGRKKKVNLEESNIEEQNIDGQDDKQDYDLSNFEIETTNKAPEPKKAKRAVNIAQH